MTSRDERTARDERSAMVALLEDRPRGLTWRQIADQVAECGSAEKVLEYLVPSDLFAEDHRVRLDRAAADIAGWEKSGIGVHTLLDDSYPAQLRDVLHMPPIVFTVGVRATDHDSRAVAIVGSRKASPEGLRRACRLATELGREGYTIVSGAAEGIDAASHTAALDTGARTVAVLGTGVRRYYPARNRDLQDRIAAAGMLLSQFWPDAPPTQYNFPLRNAVMSGYVTATVVVEAGERSGTRIQARNAVEHGRPVLLTEEVVRANAWARAIEGQAGVHVVRGISDVLSILERFEDSPAAVDRLLGLR